MKSGDVCKKCQTGRMLVYATKPNRCGGGKVRYLRCEVCKATGTERLTITAARAARRQKVTYLVNSLAKDAGLDSEQRSTASMIYSQEKTNMSTQLFDLIGLARLLTIKPSNIVGMVENGAVPPPVYIDGFARWRAADIERWIGAGCPTSDAAPDAADRLEDAMLYEHQNS